MSTPILLAMSVVIVVLVALISLSWFFKDGEDSTQAMMECVESPPYRPWWASRFGLWLGLSIGSGAVFFYGAPSAWRWLAAHF